MKQAQLLQDWLIVRLIASQHHRIRLIWRAVIFHVHPGKYLQNIEMQNAKGKITSVLAFFNIETKLRARIKSGNSYIIQRSRC